MRHALVACALVAWALAALSGCGDGDEGSVDTESPEGAGGAAASGAGGSAAGGSSAEGGGSAGGMGGDGGDLGWPFDDSLPERCEPQASEGGQSWSGWGNFQHPPGVTVEVGQSTPPLYGRVYHSTDTPLAGAASGWEAELGVGPRGTSPVGEARCWSFAPASFHLDVGHDDEWQGSYTPAEPGLYALAFRFRPPAGAWRVGDLEGADGAGELAGLSVTGGSGPLIVATLNLRCRLDDWQSRRPLVVAALARIDPDLVAFQEDCSEGAGASQASEIGALLAERTGRGYEIRRAVTHLAEGTYEEGISVLSAHPIAASHTVDLASVHFPRKALAVEVEVAGAALWFYATHFDYGQDAADARTEAVAQLAADRPLGLPVIVAGDLNATPNSDALAAAAEHFRDGWLAANPSEPGLTMPAHAPVRRIDYVLVDHGLALLGARILDEHDGIYLSDHRGVAAALSWPP